LIMKKLYEKTGQPVEWIEGKELLLVEYIMAAKQSFLKREKEVKTAKI